MNVNDPEPEVVPKKRLKTVNIKREISSPEPENVQQQQPHSEPAVKVESPYLVVETTKRQLLAYETGYLTDVTILAHNEKIRCHSQILSFASPKLASMLGEKKEFRLPDDVDPCLIRLLLQIIYSGRTSHEQHQNMDTLLKIGLAAHKLQIHAAIVYSCSQLSKLVTIRTLFCILEFANIVSSRKLIEICFQMLQRDARAVLQTEGFLKCKQSTLLQILEQDGLRNITELQILEACKRWAIANSTEPNQLRETLGKVVHKIRFLALGDSSDFTKYVCSSGLLTLLEERDIMYCILTGETSRMPRRFMKETTPRDHHRKITWSNEFKFYKYREKTYFTTEKVPSTPLRFSMNEDVHIQGVNLIVQRESKKNSGYDFEVEVSLCDKEGTVLTSEVVKKNNVMNGTSIEVKFPRPYAIFAKQVYFLQVNIIDSSDMKYAYCRHVAMSKYRHKNLRFDVLDKVWLPANISIKTC